jgi:hypothetical protein
MLLTIFYKNTDLGQWRAEIYETTGGYYIEYYSPSGVKIKTDNLKGSSIHEAASIAENWSPNTQILNG